MCSLQAHWGRHMRSRQEEREAKRSESFFHILFLLLFIFLRFHTGRGAYRAERQEREAPSFLPPQESHYHFPHCRCYSSTPIARRSSRFHAMQECLPFLLLLFLPPFTAPERGERQRRRKEAEREEKEEKRCSRQE